MGEWKTRGNWQKKVNARDEFVRATWIDLSFPGNGTRNTIATATKDLPTVPEITVLRHQESFCYGYALRDFLGKYAKDFPRGLGALCWCSSKRKG